MTWSNVHKSFLFGKNDTLKLEICRDDWPGHPWHYADMAGQLDAWGEDAGFVPDPGAQDYGRGNSDAKGFTCPEDVKKWLDDLKAQGKWGVAFGIYCFGDCNGTMKLHENVDWSDTNMDGVIYMDEDGFRKWVGDPPGVKTRKDRIDHAKRLLRNEYEMLECWVGCDVYFGAFYRKCEHCNSWAHEDSFGSYYGCKDEVELALEMLTCFSLTEAERQAFHDKFVAVAV